MHSYPVFPWNCFFYELPSSSLSLLKGEWCKPLAKESWVYHLMTCWLTIYQLFPHRLADKLTLVLNYTHTHTCTHSQAHIHKKAQLYCPNPSVIFLLFHQTPPSTMKLNVEDPQSTTSFSSSALPSKIFNYPVSLPVHLSEVQCFVGSNSLSPLWNQYELNVFRVQYKCLREGS